MSLGTALRSHAGIEFKADYETAVNFKTLKSSLNCFWKWEEGVWMFGI